MGATMRECSSCVWWSGRTESSGECRFNAPSVVDDIGEAVFPLTQPNQFCAQWTPITLGGRPVASEPARGLSGDPVGIDITG